MPLTGAQARTNLTDRAVNPVRTVAGGQVVHVELIYDRRQFAGEDVYDALSNFYGAGKVSSDRDVLGQGSLQFRIVP